MKVSTRTVIKILAVTAGFCAILYFAYLTRTILVWMLTAFALSLALNPVVAFIAKFMPKQNRLLATLLTFIILVALLAGLGFLLVPPLVAQSEQLVGDVPHYTQQLLKHGTFTGNLITKYNLVHRVEESQSQLISRLTNASGTFVHVISSVANSIIASLTILGLTFFMLMEGPNWIQIFWQTMTNPARRERAQRLALQMYKATIGYVVGKLVAAFLSGGSAAIMLTILHVPFAIPLGLVVGLFSILPVIGALIGAAIAVIVTLFSSVTSAIILMIFFFIYQLVDNNVIQPVIFNRTVAVSPLLIFTSVLMGTVVDGIFGALVAIPIVACIQIVVKDVYQDRFNQTAELAVDAKGKPAKSAAHAKA